MVKHLHAGGLLLLRLAFGLILARHGLIKLENFAGFAAKNGGSVAAACAVAGELGGGLGLAFGALTRVAGLGLTSVMWYVAFSIQLGYLHAIGTGDGTKFEYPFLVGIVGIAFAVMGAGDYSVDALLFRRRRG